MKEATSRGKKIKFKSEKNQTISVMVSECSFGLELLWFRCEVVGLKCTISPLFTFYLLCFGL
ncbi:hypothetical protein I3843_08G090200 [Carya illinoinensis]|nr:hypothetical protein I3843_08G090200 [Carya illinoinensis]